MKLYIVFYHPKNPLNLLDVASIAAWKRAVLYVVARPGLDPSTLMREPPPRLQMKVVSSLEELAAELGDDTFYLVLETYGTTLLGEIELSSREKLAIVLGAEDYGIPPEAAGKLPQERMVVARIPSAVQGMSYNVASTLAMAIYEVERQRALAAKGGTP